MTVNVTEYVAKAQQESLATMKQTQDLTLSAFEKFRAIGKELTENPGTMPSFENIPTPVQFVEMSFGFAAAMLEMRKGYAIKVAQMLAETQKQAEATVKQAQATSPTPNGTIGQKPVVAATK